MTHYTAALVTTKRALLVSCLISANRKLFGMIFSVCQVLNECLFFILVLHFEHLLQLILDTFGCTKLKVKRVLDTQVNMIFFIDDLMYMLKY